MRPYDIILKKRNGKEHTKEEIEHLIEGYTKENIPDYQLSAWAMAVFFQGMTAHETAYLTTAMAESGDMIDLSKIKGFKVDKHSTGGVGDTTTLVLAPLVAAAGLPVAKMSGRGLGHTGGTIDKLESIPGFNVNLSRDEFIKAVNEYQPDIIGLSGVMLSSHDRMKEIIKALENNVQQGEVFHLASGVELSIYDLAVNICDLAGYPEYPIQFWPTRTGEVKNNFARYDKANKILGFEPQRELKEGLEETWSWYLKHKDHVLSVDESDS